MKVSLIITLLAMAAAIQLAAAIGEAQTDNIAVLAPSDPACVGKKSDANGRGCKYANGFTINNYPPNFPCPCQQGTAGGAFLGTGKKSVANPYVGQFLEETVVATAPAENPPFNNLVGMAWTDNTKELFVITKAGQVYRIDMNTKKRTLWINLGDEANNAADKGLIGIEVNPNFAANPYVYLSITVDPIFGQPDEDMAMPTFHRILRYKSNGETADASSRQILIGNNASDGIISCSTSHIGGAVAFGHDGSLFITVGEGSHFDWNDGDYGQNLTDFDRTCANNHPNEHVGSMRAQMLDSMSGKVIRINPKTGEGICPGSGFQVSNPFCTGDAKQFRSKVWALGFRNPYSANVRPLQPGESALEPGTLYVGDVGFGSFEEVNEVQAGDNFGWPCWEGPLPAPIHRDSPWDDIPTNPQIFRPTTQNGTKINCNYIYKNLKTKHPWFYYSRYGEKRGLAGKDNGNLGQGFLGNCIGGVSFYTGNNYPAEMKNTVWILEFGQPWLRVAYRGADGSYSQIQDYNNYGTPTLDLEIEPTSKDICFLQQFKGVICIRYSSGNAAPTVSVSATPNSGAAPLTVQFSADGTFDRENDALTISWNFGNGQTSTLPNPTVTYATPGTYTATFTAKDAKGATRTGTQVITVAGNAPPKVSITSPLTVKQGPVTDKNWFFYNKDQELTFDCSVEDEDVGSLTYRWEAQMVHLNHIHPDTVVSADKKFTANVNALGAEGHGGERANFRVILTVTDNAGNQGSAEFFMNPTDWETAWGNKAAVPVFNVSGTQKVSQPIMVDAFGTLDDNLDYLWYTWNWGDGTTGSGMQTSHLYNYGGAYTITLTVYDNWSGFSTLSKEITIAGAPAPSSSTSAATTSASSSTSGATSSTSDVPSGTETNNNSGSSSTEDVSNDTSSTDLSTTDTSVQTSSDEQPSTTRDDSTSDDATTTIPSEQEGSATRGQITIAGIAVLCSVALLL